VSWGRVCVLVLAILLVSAVGVGWWLAGVLSERAVLLAENRRLEEERAKLISQCSGLESAYSELRAEHESLREKCSGLQDSYSRLKSDYDDLYSKYKSLQDSYDELKAKYSELLGKYEELSTSYTALRGEYSSIKDSYTRLRGAVEMVNKWAGILLGSEDKAQFFKGLLKLAAESVRGVGDIELQQFSGELSGRAVKIFNFTLHHMYYCYDPYVKYLDVQTMRISASQDILMLPNETWRIKCGDCDDLSLFTYAVLRATQNPGEKFYLIQIWGPRGGHTAVLAVEVTGSGKRFYIIDPAGNYLNSVGIYYKVTMTSKEGHTRDYGLDPTGISPEIKRGLLDMGLAEILFYDYRSRDKSTAPITRIYSDANELLSDWHNYWESYVGEPVLVVIIGEDTYMEFADPRGAAYWLNYYC